MPPAESPDKSLGRTAARSIGWIALDKWGARFTSLLVLIVLGRLLAPTDFGLVALASMFITFAGIFIEQGFGKALVQRRDLDPQHIDSAFWAVLAIAVLLTAATIAAAALLADLMDAPGLAPVLQWMSIGIIINAVSGVPAALLEREFKFKLLAVRRLSSTIIGAIAAVWLALTGGGVWSLVVQSLVTAIVGLIALWAATQWRPGFRFKLQALRELWPVGIGVIGIELVGFVGTQTDRLLIGVFIGAEALGLYFMAIRMIGIMVELFSSIFSALSLTIFSRLQDDQARLVAWLYRLTGASSATAVPCFALAALLAPVLLPFVLGEQWTSSVPAFQILTFLGAINAVAIFDRSILLATGRARLAFLMTLGQSLLGVALIVVGVSYGILGVAIAVVARQYLYWPVRLTILKRIFGVRPSAYLAQWLRPFAASLAMCGVLYALTWIWPGWIAAPLASAAGAGIIGFAVYLGSLFILHPQSVRDLRLTLQSLRRNAGP